jgi:hypothetical protein
MVLGIERYVEIMPAGSFGHVLVFLFRVYDDDVNVEHERTQDFQLRAVRFSGAGRGECHGIVVFHGISIEKDQRGVVTVDAVKDSFI